MRSVKRNTIIALSLLFAMLIIVMLFFSDKNEHTKTFAEFKEKLDSQSSEINVWDYFSVEYAMSMPGEKTAKPNSDRINENYISYYIRLENKTDTPIAVSAALYLSDSLRKEFVESAEPVTAAPLERVVIAPKMGYTFDVNSGMKFFASDLAPSEFNKMKEFASEVFLEVCINGKFDYKMIDFNSQCNT